MGRKPRLAVDLNMGTNLSEHGPSSSSKYVLDLQRRLNWSHKVAKKQMEKEALKAKIYYDRRVRCSQLSPGDLVLVKRMAFKGKHKVQNRWEQDIYKVLDTCRGSTLVLRVQKEDGTGKIRILHRNLLLPLRTKIPGDDLSPSSTTSQPRPEVPTMDEPDINATHELELQSATEDDDQIVSTRPWTRSQSPPIALAGTPPLSKCALNADLMGDPDELQQGLTYRVSGWVSSMWKELQLCLY